MKYERNELINIDEIYELSVKAHSKFLNFKSLTNSSFKTDIYINIKDKYIKIPFDDKKLTLEDNINYDNDFLNLNLDERLLKDIFCLDQNMHIGIMQILDHTFNFRGIKIFIKRCTLVRLNFFHS